MAAPIIAVHREYDDLTDDEAALVSLELRHATAELCAVFGSHDLERARRALERYVWALGDEMLPPGCDELIAFMAGDEVGAIVRRERLRGGTGFDDLDPWILDTIKQARARLH